MIRKFVVNLGKNICDYVNYELATQHFEIEVGLNENRLILINFHRDLYDALIILKLASEKIDKKK